jgi:uncharacterized protein YcgL (UPF0745 family)
MYSRVPKNVVVVFGDPSFFVVTLALDEEREEDDDASSAIELQPALPAPSNVCLSSY